MSNPSGYAIGNGAMYECRSKIKRSVRLKQLRACLCESKVKHWTNSSKPKMPDTEVLNSEREMVTEIPKKIRIKGLPLK